MEAREECGSNSQNLGVELRGSGHGRGPRQKNHPLCCLRMENSSDQSAAMGVQVKEQEMKPKHEPNTGTISASNLYSCAALYTE